MRSVSGSEAELNQAVGFIDFYLGISAWSFVALSLAVIGIVATWPRSGRFTARIWRETARILTRKHN